MLEVTSLGSGSSGNALLVRADEISLLVDTGVGVRSLTRSLAAHNLTLDGIDVVLITHEHGDHVRELPRFIAAGTTVVSTHGSAQATRIPRACWESCSPGRRIEIRGIEIAAIPVKHDALEPCGFFIRTREGSVSIFTDLGCPPSSATEAIAESKLVVIEANHDETMVRHGPYPRHLQRRILSESGHLSNADCGRLLTTALRGSSNLPTIRLAHLSETNNRPALARQTVLRQLASCGLILDVQVLPRRSPSETWRPNGARSGVAQLALGL